MGIYDNASWGGIGDELKRTGRGALGLDRPSSNYTDAGATDPDANGRNPNRGRGPSRVPVTQGDMNFYADARDRYDPLGVKGNTKASSEAEEHIKSLYGKQMSQQGLPLPTGGSGKTGEAAALTSRISNEYFAPSTGSLPYAGVDMGAAGVDPRQQAWLDKTGNSGYQSGGLEGKKVYNYYDPDRPGDQAKHATDTWKDMARQLATFSKLRAMGPQEIPNTGNSHMNLELLQQQGAMRRQEAAGEQAMGLEGVRGDRQLENTRLGYGLQGQNQEAHDTRAAGSAEGLERLRRSFEANDPVKGAQARMYDAQSKTYDAHSRLYGASADAAERSAKMDPYLSLASKMMAEGSLDPNNPDHAAIISGATRALNTHLNGGLEGNPKAAAIREAVQAGKISREDAKKQLAALKGEAKFAEGGQVESAEQILARMKAKYGGAPSPQTEQPAPQPRPQAPAPQQPKTWSEKMRDVATGGLERRMQGYADGGPIDVSGRQVLGAGTGKSDSLPAIIDGEHPAALSTDEYVMPIETVRYFGVAKLDKMVEQSRKGLDTGRKQA
ncbi:MAG: hypothetical protein A2Y38_16535 [Spirochaetes bacterium GWB1_59_5]|nr:MAG: hypothetical protein A2Y38_16535 [Spirochaetes bacterium GWB1_59_5]